MKIVAGTGRWRIWQSVALKDEVFIVVFFKSSFPTGVAITLIIS